MQTIILVCGLPIFAFYINNTTCQYNCERESKSADRMATVWMNLNNAFHPSHLDTLHKICIILKPCERIHKIGKNENFLRSLNRTTSGDKLSLVE